MNEIQDEISELLEVKQMVESHLFQKYFAIPMKHERDKLRPAFFSDSLKESWRKGGRQEGIELFLSIVKQIPIDLKNKKYELEDSRRVS